MTFVWIFAASYIVAFIGVFNWSRRANSRAAAHLRTLGANDKQVSNFHRQASPPFLFVQLTLFFGTILGVISSLIFWAFSK